MIDQKQPENVEYFSNFGSMIKNVAIYTRGIKSMVSTAQAAPQKQKVLSASKLE